MIRVLRHIAPKKEDTPDLSRYKKVRYLTILEVVYLRDCLVSPSGLRTGLFSPSTPAFSARSWATNLKSRPPLGRKSLVLAYGLTYQTVSERGRAYLFLILKADSISNNNVLMPISHPLSAICYRPSVTIGAAPLDTCGI